MTQYLSEDKIAEYIDSPPAVIIDWTASLLTEEDGDFKTSITPDEQFIVEINVFCSKSDDEADYQWWETHFENLAEAEGLDASNVQFIINADDENNPNPDLI